MGTLTSFLALQLQPKHKPTKPPGSMKWCQWTVCQYEMMSVEVWNYISGQCHWTCTDIRNCHQIPPGTFVGNLSRNGLFSWLSARIWSTQAKLHAEMCVVSAHALSSFSWYLCCTLGSKRSCNKGISENNTYYCMILRSFAVGNLQLIYHVSHL